MFISLDLNNLADRNKPIGGDSDTQRLENGINMGNNANPICSIPIIQDLSIPENIIALGNTTDFVLIGVTDTEQGELHKD